MHTDIRQKAIAQLNGDTEDQRSLTTTLRLLSKWRSVLIQNTLVEQQGTTILQGPFKGMDFLPQSAEGCHVAKLLGCYEQPLHPFIEQAINSSYELILNIGCAEGYYAVGLAKRMPQTMVLAFDLNISAQKICVTLAHQNKVEKRVLVSGVFKPENFAEYKNKKTLVVCDVEGAERELLNPGTEPALKNMDIIVESHECLTAGITQLLVDRFKDSHHITLIQDDGQRRIENPAPWFLNLAHLDQLLATWEWRSGPTPWLVMKSKQGR